MGFDIDAISKSVKSGPLVRILILDHKGSVPREMGTSMLVSEKHNQGTIGGGALEQTAIEVAKGVLKTGKSLKKTIPLGPDLAQCCGGSVTLFWERFVQYQMPSTDGFYARPIKQDAEVTLPVKRMFEEYRNASVNVDVCVKDGWVFERIEKPKQPVWIYGAGHVGRSIVQVLDGMPFDVTWVDTNLERFPLPAKATTLIAQSPSDAVKHAPSNAHHLVMTYSHLFDFEICHSVLSQEFRTLGLIGSKTKKVRFSKRLLALGHSSQTVSQINCPIGDKNLGKEPKLIAIGVVNELLAFGRNYVALGRHVK